MVRNFNFDNSQAEDRPMNEGRQDDAYQDLLSVEYLEDGRDLKQWRSNLTLFVGCMTSMRDRRQV